MCYISIVAVVVWSWDGWDREVEWVWVRGCEFICEWVVGTGRERMRLRYTSRGERGTRASFEGRNILIWHKHMFTADSHRNNREER